MAAEKIIDLLIIGNGAAGNCAALAARRADAGMSITVLGMEKHCEYSNPALPDYLSGELPLEKMFVRDENSYKENKIDLKLNDKVIAIEPEKNLVRTESGKKYSYKNLIISTGSFPIQLRRMKGTGLPGNFVMKTIDDVEAILAYPGKRAVVVGSGAIGLEGCIALKQRGYEAVTMVEGLDWMSPKSLDFETADALAESVRKHGVEVFCGEAVSSVEGEDKVTGVKTEKRFIPCDLILWGVGMRADTELAKNAGIELGELGGIRVDDHMRTNFPNIYACGDCIESTDRLSGKPAMHLFWEPAQRGGTVAGENCAGLDRTYTGSTAVFLTHKGGLSVAAFGKTEMDLKDRDYRVIEERRPESYRRLLIEEGRLAGAQMVNILEDVDLMLDEIQKHYDVSGGRRWVFPDEIFVPEEGTTVVEYLNHMKKNRRVMVKR